MTVVAQSNSMLTMKNLISARSFGPLLGLSLLFAPQLRADKPYTIGGKSALTFKLEEQAWLSALTPDEAGLEGGLRIYRHGREEPLALRFLRSEKSGEQTIAYYQASEEVSLKLTIAQFSEGYLQAQLEISNHGKESLLLEPELSSAFPKTGYRWFDGFSEHQKALHREEISGTLPFAAIYGEKRGIALGLNPGDLVSHFKSEVKERDAKAYLSFSSRMVIQPGETEARRFVIFAFQPDYGYRNAIGDYQRFFASRFQAHPEIHPEINGPLIGGLLWRTQNDRYLGKNPQYNGKITDVIRWMGGGWEWCYAGFGYRPGDWLCTEEQTGEWMLPTKNGPVAFKDHFKKTAKEYLQQHLDAYERIRPYGTASLMYIIPNYCEEELAKERYGDSIYYDEQNQPRSAGPPWVVQHDRSLQMYPYGNSFGDYTLEAIKTLVERSDIDGFAFDCIDRARYPYRGPGVERSPGRAYDDQGRIFVNSEIAHAKFGEAVHALSRDGHTMALTGNFRGDTGSYLAANVLDAALIEHEPWDERPLALNTRYLLGRKSITYLRGYGRIPEISVRKDEQLVEMVDTLASYSVLQSLRLGIYPNFRYVIGAPKLIYYMPIFNTLFRKYQWNPVPAATGPRQLWITRYGYDNNGVLYVGNPSAQAVKGDVHTASSYFRAASTAWVDFEGRLKLVNRVGNEKTSVPIDLPRGEALLLQAGLYSAKEYSGDISSERSLIKGKGYIDQWTFSSSAEHPWFLIPPPGHLIAEIRINGKEVGASTKGGKVEIAVGKGTQVVEVHYHADLQLGNPELLVKAPFLKDGKEVNFAIQIPSDTSGYQQQVRKIGSFFSNFVHGMAKPELRFDVSGIIKGEALPEEGMLIILEESSVPPGQPRVSIEGRTVTIRGNDVGQISEGVDLLLNTLHEQYPYYGYLQVSDKSIPADHRVLEPSLFQENTSHSYLPWKR